MHTVNFDHIHPSIILPFPSPFQTAFGGFHYGIPMCIYGASFCPFHPACPLSPCDDPLHTVPHIHSCLHGNLNLEMIKWNKHFPEEQVIHRDS
jgi:hypothetical protein